MGYQGYKGWQYGYYDADQNFVQAQAGTWGQFTPQGLSLTGVDTPKQLVLRWRSFTSGSSEVKLESLSTESNNIQQNILLNGKSILSEINVKEGKKGYEINTFEVENSSLLDFVFETSESNLASQFLFNSAVRVSSNIANSAPVNPIVSDPIHIESTKYKLVLYKNFDHIALYANGYLYEAHPQYGVRKYAAPASFAADTRSIELSENIGTAMAAKIESKLDCSYLNKTNANPAEQKGLNNSFTNIGLIEWAAEETGYRGNQGFINNHLESQDIVCLFNFSCSNNWKFKISNIYHSFVTDSLRSLSISYSFQEYVKFEAARAQNLVVGTSSYEDVLQYRNSLNIDREIEKFIYQTGNSLSIFEPSSPFDMPSSENPFALLPESIENAYIENYFQKTPRFFQANFDSQYFTITNPLGRRIGYTNKGFFNEIEDVFYQSSNTHSSIQTSGSPAPITVADGKTFTIPYGTSLDNTNNNQNSLLP
ncbi:MAG: hypothetical protein SAJ11_16750, partial [Jaaginema sp. PMC 1078.18]|nr:hypothetical protein [Jaaginema sp. PMC 1078.18]